MMMSRNDDVFQWKISLNTLSIDDVNNGFETELSDVINLMFFVQSQKKRIHKPKSDI